jgi:hypothetical protein
MMTQKKSGVLKAIEKRNPITLSYIRRLPVCLITVLALVGWSEAARADIFIFHDLTDTMTVEHIGDPSNLISTTCGLSGNPSIPAEVCFADIIGDLLPGPTRASLVSPAIPFPALPVYEFDILEQNGTRSDAFTLNATGGCDNPVVTCRVGVELLSDIDGSILPPLGFLSLGQLTEDGTVQTAFTLTWSDGRVDTVKFESNVSEVPEPATFIMLGCGLFGLAGMYRRRYKRS